MGCQCSLNGNSRVGRSLPLPQTVLNRTLRFLSKNGSRDSLFFNIYRNKEGFYIVASQVTHRGSLRKQALLREARLVALLTGSILIVVLTMFKR